MSIVTLSGTIVYCQVREPVACYDADKGHEYKCGVVVDEDTADSFAEQFPKQAARKVKRSDFEQLYKVAPPEGSEKNLYIITLKKNSQITDRKTNTKIPLYEKYKPRVLQRQGNALLDITQTIKPANGSTGIVSYEVGETKYGDVARLKNVLIENLIEYQEGDGSGYEIGDEFASAKAGSTPAPKPPAKAATKKPKVEEDFEEDSMPF